MIWPPSLLRIRIQNGRRRFGLWLPLILLWPPIVLITLALFPIVLVSAAVLWRRGWGRPLLLSGPLFFGLFCALRGLRIDIKNQQEWVYISFKPVFPIWLKQVMR